MCLVVVLFEKEVSSDIWREIGRTEIVWNNLNPDFVTKVEVDYYFEENQSFLIEAYDMDDNTDPKNL